MNYDEEILKHSPSYIDKELTEEQLDNIELAEECGLVYTGLDDEGRPEFIGDNRAWGYYNDGGRSTI